MIILKLKTKIPNLIILSHIWPEVKEQKPLI